MLTIIEPAKKIKEDVEVRIVRDDNGFYLHQIRILPIEDYHPYEGWDTDYISSIPLTLTKPYPYIK